MLAYFLLLALGPTQSVQPAPLTFVAPRSWSPLRLRFSAAAFSSDGRYLLYAGSRLHALDQVGGIASDMLSPPFSEADAAAFLAVSPATEPEIVVVILRKDIFLTQNRGRNWKWIAREGLGL